ncbi:MAG: LptF/LptG family permease [Bryobacteraceae bacterium]
MFRILLMGILHRYVFREIFSSALLGTILATFVIFLQSVGQTRLFELLVRSSPKWETVVYLLALSLGPVLPLTVPFGVLIGILIGLGRLSSDGEITAMRAAGIPSRKLILPVVVFALMATSLAGAASLWLSPLAIRETYRIVNELARTQLTAEIQPRVFQEEFPNTILYVGEVRPGPVVVWERVFMADLTPPEHRQTGLREKAEGPRITVAREAIAVSDPEHNRIQLRFKDASSHEIDKEAIAHDSTFPRGDQALVANPPNRRQARPFSEMDTYELRPHVADKKQVDARIELHRRLALPLACLMLALVGMSLGISSRKGGKSAGYVMGIFLAFFCYHLAFISLTGVARQRTLPVEVALWIPNAAFALAGIVMLLRLERPGERDVIAALGAWSRRFRARPPRLPQSLNGRPRIAPPSWLPPFPQIVDKYVLTRFLFYFFLLLASFVLMTHVYTFFELLGDIIRNRIPMSRVLTYLLFLTPKLIYDTTPISVLVAVLVTFGVMTKHNEVIAFKACGVSVHRLSAPVLLVSAVLSVALFAFDHYYVPEANIKQDAIRDEIKGRPTQTYLRPDRKWIFGSGSRIYYYRHFDAAGDMMVGVNVYELEPSTFVLKRHISAELAEWQPQTKAWVFHNGWSRDVGGQAGWNFQTFEKTTFPELDERPEYFLKEEKQHKQMNFQELDAYIRDLQQSGFGTVRLRVQFHKKFSVPLFALIMAMISVPFGFLVGNRGAMAGIGVSIGVAMAYWGIGRLFEEAGNLNLLPPAVAAWSPDSVFALAGLYLLLRMRS